jgi:hypothetical protein
VNGFGQGVYYKVDLSKGTGGVGVLRISSSESAINGATCASANCAQLDIDGTKLPEYLLAYLNSAVEIGSVHFQITPGPTYSFSYEYVDYNNRHNIYSLEFSYTSGTGTDIKIKLRNNGNNPGRPGIIRLPDNPTWAEQRKVDYMLSILFRTLDKEENIGLRQRICFSTDNNGIITDLVTARDIANMNWNCSTAP